MEYKKIINLLDNTPNQPTKFRTKNWVEINDESRRTYSTNSQITFKTSMLRSSLCDYSDAYILVKGTIANNCAITAGIKKYQSIIKKKKKKHDKIVLLAKFELNSIEVLISKALINSVISHDEFVLINNVIKEYIKMKEEIKNLKT